MDLPGEPQDQCELSQGVDQSLRPDGRELLQDVVDQAGNLVEQVQFQHALGELLQEVEVVLGGVADQVAQGLRAPQPDGQFRQHGGRGGRGHGLAVGVVQADQAPQVGQQVRVLVRARVLLQVRYHLVGRRDEVPVDRADVGQGLEQPLPGADLYDVFEVE